MVCTLQNISNNMKKYFIIVSFFFVALNVFGQAETLPAIEIKDLDGQSYNTSLLIDSQQYTIISFWATWCGPCIKELEAIKKKYAEWQATYKVKLCAVSIDDARNSNKVKPKVLALNWPYQILLDQNMDFARALNVQNPPMLFIVDTKGNIVYSHQGYNPGSEEEIEEKLKEFTGKK